MKKQEQQNMNEKVLEAMEKALTELDKYSLGYWEVNETQLRSCTAWVLETTNYYFLRSYNTIVAVVDKNTGVCYDFLRYVWGYSVTSAKHIAYFDRIYGELTSAHRITYYPV